MTSPYVRRRRLAVELRKLREERDLTTDELARLVFQSRPKISKLENAQIRPDLAEVVTILQALEVTGRRYDRLFKLAHSAARKSWWDRFGNAMGDRQRLYADLESGAKTIRSYNQTGIPAVLQTPELIAALIELDLAAGPVDYRPERMTEARTRRQQHLLNPDGPAYESVLDECVIYRLGVPRPVMSAQLRHLVKVVSTEQRITIRVLRYDAHLVGELLPKSSFSLYGFPEKADPPMAVVDTGTTDLILTERRAVKRYTRHYDLLRKAALSPAESLAFLSQVAEQLNDGTERSP
ncbi:Helix-turn-helix domain-containing protein [Thermomonospora echinospora]|uniref:Helix-turn-helix domain-containing protein n=1 Tax=Thermomonospora echinospora TaxID=1992 RepID=A0A1H5T532_9ACTN|nr:helix-turn-helix transcriptional regulator [Thermomonospora echinospora]SEF57906.1 Helix-turn-helix domain-containing protein [Thermomonospora echinospora]